MLLDAWREADEEAAATMARLHFIAINVQSYDDLNKILG